MYYILHILSLFKERFERDINSLIQDIIDEVVKKECPGSELKKSDKLEMLGKLDKRGLLLAKGAALRLARSLKVSSPTINKY